MRSLNAAALLALFASALVASVLLTGSAFCFTVSKYRLTVYRDGVVHVEVCLAVNETEPAISIPLLAGDAYNILTVDENMEPLSYDVNGSTLTVYTLGATSVTVEYDTDTLTSKEAGVWTLKLTAPFHLTVTLPKNSTIIYLSSPPSTINVEGSTITLTLQPGDWEVSYELPVAPPSPSPAPSPTPSPQPTPSPAPTPLPRPQPAFQWPQYAAIAAVVAVAVGVLLVALRRRRRAKSLRTEEEAEVVKFIKESGGRVMEAELREVFPHIPRTSMWRLIRRLERRGVVRVRKVGMQNVVELA